MSGIKTDKEKLNYTLEAIVNILHKENIDDWFIMFGTLLGIVREDSCIQHDDDIDIVINYDYKKLRSAFEGHGFAFNHPVMKRIKEPEKILKSEDDKDYASFDFFICDVNEQGDYYTRTSLYECRMGDCQPFKKKPWRSTILHLPNSYTTKLVSLYGEDWRVPKIGAKMKREKIRGELIV